MEEEEEDRVLLGRLCVTSVNPEDIERDVLTKARERAWRIGQTRDVTVYRLRARGTIDEKVYHRQICKHFFTNKIPKNLQQRRFFKARDFRDLLTLQDEVETGSTETSNIFKELSGDVNVVCDNEQNNHEPQEMNPAVKRTRSTDQKSNSESEGKEKSDEIGGKLGEDTNILKSLFDAQGIHMMMIDWYSRLL